MESKTSSTTPVELERPDLYINRELSWIEFNRRVFEEAKNPRHPLLERVKFISIFETNLDEFMMIRIAGLKDQVAARTPTRSPDGRTAEEQIAAVRQLLAPLTQEVRHYWRTELLPLLAEQHIHILDYEQLDRQQREAMRAYFENEVFPVLTPLAVDSVHPFPHISNLSLNLAVVLTDASHGSEHFARVKIPPSLPRLVPIPTATDNPQIMAFVWLEQVIAAHLSMLFPGFDVWESYPFRVLRDADIELQEDDAADLLEYIEQEVRERRFGTVVDLAVNPAMPQRIRRLLLDNLEITERDLTVIDGPLGMGSVAELTKLDKPDLKDKPFTPHIPALLRRTPGIFNAIQKHDILLHHPYDSFSTIVDFISEAAEDPGVLAIKQTLYRVGQNSPIVEALLRAAENGKQVAVLVELKARFDEENNIVWAQKLERAGVHVVYGLIGLKTHAKMALVVRREEHGLRRYVHLGTGNYNATTGRVYEDLGLLTCQPDICNDLTMLFNSLTGYSRQVSYRKLLVAPVGLRRGISERIEREIRLHEEHGNGRLIFKMNQLTDPAIIRLLYRASQAGVKIDLIIRGVCCLRPGIVGVSENIRVRSIVGRFLEHSRVYYFGNNGRAEIFVGSADMMQRNLNGRVEVLFPVELPTLREALLKKMLHPLLADTVNARLLQPDERYVRLQPANGEEAFDSQQWFITHPLFDMEEDEEGETISAIPSSA
ncbi:polyphosphate kinase [Thermosporothrix hazakensis]|jgi:polyphosphate kinase|uniref:Polyphosphate kinase n=2 Tax=Thermosporothrix TaxID=768650 RepID=A0A326TS28_THEHA|nr:polyphosphate kinase 1 [Thermosporothrix hazakensis]PZW19211.1 polyphosphate kinase [Thermosporothrix hazakensis]BBH89705.1 polyphosphate kinase [Thermosporothrix sp. COM3]GCE47892.1 polyphosphate kinase [Thermosporothrix hazakensis]